MRLTNLKLCLVFKIIFFIGLLVIMVSCGHSYKYKGENFRSPEEALAAQKADLDGMKSQIEPAGKRKGGSAAIVIPTFDTLVALGIRKTGNPSQELIDIVGKSLMLSYRNMCESLEKRNIFNKLTIIEDNYPIPAAKKIIVEYDAVIYLNLAGPDQAQWFMRSAPEYKNVLLDMDKSKAEGNPRIMSWLDNIERNLETASYKPKR